MLRSILPLVIVLTASLQAQTGVLEFSRLTDDVYVYTTYNDFDGTPFPSNSLYVVTKSGVVLIDTPWEAARTAPLLDSIAARHRQPVVLCVVTHSHDDRTAGLDTLRARGIPTFSMRRSKELGEAIGNPVAERTFERDTTFTVGGFSFTTFHPGEGHTEDNIVVWIPNRRVLFGGCLVKSVESPGLGNVADANLKQWGASIRAVMKRFPRPRFVVPGHFGWSTTRSLAHTLELLRKAQ